MEFHRIHLPSTIFRKKMLINILRLFAQQFQLAEASNKLENAPTGFTKVQNEPPDPNSIIDHRSLLLYTSSISTNNETAETTVDDNDHSIGTPFIISVWILSASIAKIGFHKAPRLNQIFPESCLLIVIGVFIGVLLHYGSRLDVSPLTPNTFFLYMLPPIIFDAGYFMPNRLFFENLGTILLMAVVGTIFNIFAIGKCARRKD